jgi:hypothetical protein
MIFWLPQAEYVLMTIGWDDDKRVHGSLGTLYAMTGQRE